MSILSQLGTKRKFIKTDERMHSSKSVHSQKLDTDEDNMFYRDDESKIEEISPTPRGPQFSQQKGNTTGAGVCLETIDERGDNEFIKSQDNENREFRLIKMNSSGSEKDYPILTIENNYSVIQKKMSVDCYRDDLTNDEMKTDRILLTNNDVERNKKVSHHFRVKSEIQPLRQSRQREESTDSAEQQNDNRNTVPQMESEEQKVHPEFSRFSEKVKRIDGRKNYKKIINHQCIHLEGFAFEDYVLKEFLRKQRFTLHTICIKECNIKNKSRIEALYMIFLQDDLQVGDFPKLKNIEIDFAETENDMNNNKQTTGKKNIQSVFMQSNAKKILRSRVMYQKTIDEIQKEFQVVKKMEYCIQCDGQVMILNQLAFQDKKAFFYIKRHLAQKAESLRCLVFINIANLRKNSLKSIFENLRECTTLQEINFINTIINKDSLILIRNILTWFSAELHSIKFIENELNENDLQLLFLDKNHLHISDLYNLEELIIQKNPQACNSSSYHDIMKIFKKQIEIAGESREKAICLPLFSSVTYLSSRPHFKLFPFNLQPRKYILQFNDDHQFESYSDELDDFMLDMLFRIQYTDFCQQLDLSQVSFLGADPGMINLLAEVICDSKSVQVVLQMLEQKILHKNEHGQKNKLNSKLIQLNKTFLEFKILGSQSSIFKNKNMKSIVNIAFFVNDFTIDFQGTNLQQDALLGFINGLINCKNSLEEIGKRQNIAKYLEFQNENLVAPFLKSFSIQNAGSLEDIQPIDFKNFLVEFFTLFGSTLEQFSLENVELEHTYIDEIERALKIASSELEKIGQAQYALKKFGLSRRGKYSIEFDELYLVLYKQFPQLNTVRFQQNEYIPRSKHYNQIFDSTSPRIISLDLSGINLKKGYYLWQQVFQILFSQPSIQQLSLSESNFDINCVEEFLVEFLKAKERCKLFGLKEINLSKTDLSKVSLLFNKANLGNYESPSAFVQIQNQLNHSTVNLQQNLRTQKTIKMKSSLLFQVPYDESQEVVVPDIKQYKKSQTMLYYFFDALFNFTKIRYLDLSDCQLCSQGLSVLVNRIKQSANIQTSLRYINISGNAQASKKLGQFLECIFDYLTNAEEIYIQDFGNISVHLPSFYMQIIKKKKRLENLRILDLSGTYFVPQNEEQIDDLALVIFELIINCSQLNISKGITSSILSQRISEKLFYELHNHSKNIYRLTSINISHNPNINSNCWKMLIKSLMLNFSHCLESLDISYCELNSEKIQNVLEAIEEAQNEVKNQAMPMMKLCRFIMKGNHQLSEDKQAGLVWQNIIFKLMSQKQINLTEINIEENRINDQIAECLLRGLKQANAKTLSDPIEKCIYGLTNISFNNNYISRKMIVQLKNSFLLHFCNNVSIQNIEYKSNLQQNMDQFRQNRDELTQKVKLKHDLDLENTSQKILQKFILGELCASSVEGCVDILKNVLLSFNKIGTLEVYVKFPQRIINLWNEPQMKAAMAVQNPKQNCQIKNLMIRLVKGTDVYEYQWASLLKGFFLLSNQITGVYIEKAGLTGGALKIIVQEIMNNLKGLQEFSIADNPSIKSDLEVAGQSLKTLIKENSTDLRVLNLRNCNLCDIVIEQLCSGFKGQELASLETVDLSQNSLIKQNGWYLLFKNILQYSRITSLNISQCLINNSCVNSIVKAFKELIQQKCEFSLTTFNFSMNSSIQVDGWNEFFPALFEALGQSLQNLDLSYCAMDGLKTQAFTKALSNYRKSQLSIALISKFFTIINNLYNISIQKYQDLNFSGNHFKQKDVWSEFIEEVLSIQGILKLNLKDCDFEDKQITAITNKIYSMEIESTLEELDLTNCSGSSVYYYDLKKEKYKTSLIKSVFGLSSSLFTYLKVIHLENCIKTRQSARNFLQTFIDLSNSKIQSQFLEELYLSGNKISGQTWSKLIPLIFEFQSQIKVLGIDRDIKLNKEDYAEQEYLDGLAKGFEQVYDYDLRLETIIFSDHRRNRQESWYNLLNVILNEKKVYKTIKHILVRSQENFVHESAFFLAFSELINTSNLTQESTMTKSFTLFEKTKGQGVGSTNTIFNIKKQPQQQQVRKQLAQLQTIAFSDKSLQTYILPAHFLQSILKGIVSCIENGQIMVEKSEDLYIDNFWKDKQEQDIKIMVRPWHSIMKFQGGINENDFQKKTELYSSLNDIRKLLSIGKEELILDFDFDYRKFPLFSITNPLAYNPYKMNEINLEEIFGDIANLYFDYPLYCFLVECCSIYPGENINEFFVKFTQTFANKNDNHFQKIQTTPMLSLTNEDKNLIQDALSIRYNQQQQNNSIAPRSVNQTPTLKPLTEDQGNDSPSLKPQNAKKSGNLSIVKGGPMDSSLKLPQIIQQSIVQKKSPFVNYSPQKKSGELSLAQRSLFSKVFRKRAPLNVLCPYFFDSEKVENQSTEGQILERLEYMPASSLKVKNLSISALKSIYSSCYMNPYFMACEMDYPFHTFLNVSLAYSMREKIFESHKPVARYRFLSPLNKITWKITNALVSLDSYFEFDENTIVLNEYLEEHQILRRTLIVFFVLYFLICFFAPYPLTYYDDLLDKKGRGISWKSHILYAVFAIITMMYEAYLVSIVIKQTNHLVPGIRLGGQPDCPTRFMDYLKTKLMNIQMFGYKNLLYIIQLLLSQQNRFDQYSDFCFLIVLFQHQRYDLYLIWALILIINQYLVFKKAWSFFFKDTKQTMRTYYFTLSQFINFNSFADLLDIISPCNTSVVQTNFLNKLFFPNLCGKAINNRMFRVIIDCLVENIPQLIVQMFFFAQSTTSLDITALLSLASSVITLILTIFKLITIGQSIITQLDFDNLSIIKQFDMKQVMENFRFNESKMVEQIKGVCIKSEQNNTPLIAPDNESIDSPAAQSEKQKVKGKGITSKLKNLIFKKTNLAVETPQQQQFGKDSLVVDENSKQQI